jgi:hypothetical protein
MAEMINDENIQVKYGIICLLDALGVSNYTTDGAKSFLKNRDVIVEDINNYKPAMKDLTKYKGDLEIFTFGDTILLCWQTPEARGGKLASQLLYMGELIRDILATSLSRGVLLRGAISIGEYISDSKTVIGPAVADAAAWYEEADWAGLIATPATGLTIQHLSEEANINLGKEDSYSIMFIKYDVPLKNKEKINLYVSPWPYTLCHVSSECENKRTRPISVISKFLV